MDLNDMEPDSPVLWLRIDPELELIRMVKLDQPDYMWQYMLRHERCVVAQSQVGSPPPSICSHYVTQRLSISPPKGKGL